MELNESLFVNLQEFLGPLVLNNKIVKPRVKLGFFIKSGQQDPSPWHVNLSTAKKRGGMGLAGQTSFHIT